jgi:hypothetical protein
MGMILGIIGVVLLVGSIYFAISYVGAIMNTMIEFVATNSGAISRCGITMPDEIVQLKDQVATTILPALYLGIPLAVVVISAVMFAGGYYYGRGSIVDEMKRERKHEEEMEEEVERRMGRRKRKPKEEPGEEEEEE